MSAPQASYPLCPSRRKFDDMTDPFSPGVALSDAGLGRNGHAMGMGRGAWGARRHRGSGGRACGWTHARRSDAQALSQRC